MMMLTDWFAHVFDAAINFPFTHTQNRWVIYDATERLCVCVCAQVDDVAYGLAIFEINNCSKSTLFATRIKPAGIFVKMQRQQKRETQTQKWIISQYTWNNVPL